MNVRHVVVLLCLPLALLSAGPAAAQGHRGSPPGRAGGGAKPEPQSPIPSAPPASTSGSSASSTTDSSTALPALTSESAPYFGSWLDDASVIEENGAWFGLSMGYWRANLDRQIDVPVMSGAVGLGSGVQLGASVPVYHFRAADGFSASGVGSVWVYGKAAVYNPDKPGRRVGVAMIPVLEIAPGNADHHLGWGFPVSVEVRGDGLRMYGSSGYFSRGAFFVAAAVEARAGDHASIAGTLARSAATEDTAASPLSSIARSQTDLGVSVAYALSNTAGLFGTLGRTSAADDAGGFWFGGGISIRMSPLTLHRP